MLPIKKRSTALSPVAPQIIKSMLCFLARSLGIFTFGDPYSPPTSTVTLLTPGSSANFL